MSQLYCNLIFTTAPCTSIVTISSERQFGFQEHNPNIICINVTQNRQQIIMLLMAHFADVANDEVFKFVNLNVCRGASHLFACNQQQQQLQTRIFQWGRVLLSRCTINYQIPRYENKTTHAKPPIERKTGRISSKVV